MSLASARRKTFFQKGLTFRGVSAIIIMSRGMVGKLQGKVLDNLKKSKKPLDNGLPPCYNNNVKRGYTQLETNRHQTIEWKTDR